MRLHVYHIVFLILIFVSSGDSTEFQLYLYDGNVLSLELSEIRSTRYEEADQFFEIYMVDGNVHSFAISDIRKLTFDNLTGVDQSELIQVKALVQLKNFPNPFNSTTKIKYSLVSKENVEIIIFDISGKRVRSLYSGPQESGVHLISWDGKSDHGKEVCTGLYFCKVQYGEHLISARMLLLK